MKILLFEYITGGGFNKQALPGSLASEGRLMLNALLDNLSRLNHLDITLMLDWRLCDAINTTGLTTIIINPEHDISDTFSQCVKQADAVWPVAPEFDGILQSLCQIVGLSGKTLLTSPAVAVAIAGDKFKTYELLNRHHINVVHTRLFENSYVPGEWMVKPLDGVGCADSYVITGREEFEQMAAHSGQYIIQPHLQGDKTSLSCLFKHGRAWLMCANLQHFDFINRQYHLAEIVVNHHTDTGVYQPLINGIACALPELWGYVGIDLIETAGQTRVLEINPRLTTSFTGIYAALGINIAELVLQLAHGEPIFKPSRNKAVSIQIQQETHAN